MALGTFSTVRRSTFGNFAVRILDVQPTSGANYTTGGESLTPQQIGLKQVITAVAEHAKNAAGTNVLPVEYDRVNSKVQVYRYDGASAGKASLEEAAASFDASTFTARITFIGVV